MVYLLLKQQTNKDIFHFIGIRYFVKMVYISYAVNGWFVCTYNLKINETK